MVRRTSILGILTLALLCAGAEINHDALRSGYAAYLRAEYDTAIRYYEQAVKSSSDPGPLAGDLGSLFARAERYQEAALWFSRSLEDASGVRRARSAYGLATSLTHQGNKMQGRRAVALLQQALQSYEVALREVATLSPNEIASISTLKADAETNRSIAQALLTQKQKEPEPPQPPEDEAPPSSADVSMNEAGGGTSNGSRAMPLNGRNSSGNGNETGTSDSTAGRGNLPPLPDNDQAPPLSAEEAQRRLDQLMQRLRKPLAPHAGKPGTKDW
ncbi:MAG TPA: hypothetical protein PLN21_08310 [Gemmatales bacterium]|nr:hypothetical protein [Gemmatales bacterium]